MEKERLARKLQKSNPQQKLFDHIVKQSHSNSTASYPLFSLLSGMSKYKNKIETFVIEPLLGNTNTCKNILFRGASGLGKTFLVESICNEYKLKLLVCKSSELLETLQKARVIKKCIVLIYDLEKIEDYDLIYKIIKALQNNSEICVIAEVNNQVDTRFRKYGCFEEEIVFDVPEESDKVEILQFLYQKYISKPNVIDFIEIAKYIPAYTPSDISILTRRVLVKIDKGLECNTELYFDVLKENNIKKTSTTLDDIGGMESVKKELYKYLIAPIINSREYRKFDIRVSMGILFYGPPGCGKTLLAKAVSNSACCNFISVKGPEIINKYVGNTEKALREIFDKAQSLRPCVIFFDEIDSLCAKRGNNDFNDRVVNQFLALMDGFESRDNVYILGATNRKDKIDDAFLRPGRFDRCIEIPLPDLHEKEKIFKVIIKDRNCEKFDFAELDTTNFSGADIFGVVQQAFIEFINDNPGNTDKTIEKKYFVKAAINLQKERSK